MLWAQQATNYKQTTTGGEPKASIGDPCRATTGLGRVCKCSDFRHAAPGSVLHGPPSSADSGGEHRTEGASSSRGSGGEAGDLGELAVRLVSGERCGPVQALGLSVRSNPRAPRRRSGRAAEPGGEGQQMRRRWECETGAALVPSPCCLSMCGTSKPLTPGLRRAGELQALPRQRRRYLAT